MLAELANIDIKKIKHFVRGTKLTLKWSIKIGCNSHLDFGQLAISDSFDTLY